MSNNFKTIKPFVFWCQKILPLAYDDSLSYYEMLCKVVNTLNEVINNVNDIPDFIRDLVSDEKLKEILAELLNSLEEQIASANEKNSETATADRNVGDLVWLNDLLYRCIKQMDNGDKYVLNSNIEKINIESLYREIQKTFCEYIEDSATIASKTIANGTWFWYNNKLCLATKDIEQGNGFVTNTNYVEIDVASMIHVITNMINDETDAREKSDAELQNAINTEQEERVNAINNLQTDLNDKTTKLQTELTTETNNRINADKAFDNRLVPLETNVNTLLSSTLKWVNAVKYGFVNDGVTNNDDAMTRFIANDSDKVLYFENGVYNFKSPINFTNEMHLWLDPNAVLYVDADATIDYFITIRKGSTRSDYSKNSFIHGGTLNCNYKAKKGFGSNKCICQGLLDSVRIINVLQYGIVASTETSVDGANVYRNISIENTKGVNEVEVTGTCGIWDVATDNTYDNIEIVNMQTGIRTVNGTFSNIKMWIRSKNLIGDSLGVYIWGKPISFVNVVIDTYRYGFSNTDENEQKAIITNLWWIRNGNVYTDEIADQNESVIFRSDNPTRNFYVTNAVIQTTRNTLFSNIELPQSQFINIVTENGTNITTLRNGRNDSVKVVTITGTTDQYGQLSYDNYMNIKACMVVSPVKSFATLIDGGILVLTTDGNSISGASNKAVTVKAIL